MWENSLDTFGNVMFDLASPESNYMLSFFFPLLQTLKTGLQIPPREAGRTRRERERAKVAFVRARTKEEGLLVAHKRDW